MRRLSRQTASLLSAAGLDPELCTVFVQSHVDEHARLSYLWRTTPTRCRWGTTELAVRFDQRYGHTFVVPRATSGDDLQEPTSTMGKSDDSGPGIVCLSCGRR